MSVTKMFIHGLQICANEIKVGSGVSDSLDPEKGTYDTTTKLDDSKKEYDQRH